MKPKKFLGQNWLLDQNVIGDLLTAAEISGQDVVLEIGAGTGAVTKKLATEAKHVIAVEFDRDLIPELTKNLASFKNVTILNANILDLPLSKLPDVRCQMPVDKSELATGNWLLATKIIGAIPYQITSPLFHKIFFEHPPVKKMAFIIQKEVAEKITAQPPDGNYWSNFIRNYASVELSSTIPPEAFFPPPAVDSAIIGIAFKKTPRSDIPPPKWSHFLHRGFAHPRQMLPKSFPKEVLTKLQIDPTRRPQTLSLEEWHQLFDAQPEISSTKFQ